MRLSDPFGWAACSRRTARRLPTSAATAEAGPAAVMLQAVSVEIVSPCDVTRLRTRVRVAAVGTARANRAARSLGAMAEVVASRLTSAGAAAFSTSVTDWVPVAATSAVVAPTVDEAPEAVAGIVARAAATNVRLPTSAVRRHADCRAFTVIHLSHDARGACGPTGPTRSLSARRGPRL